MNKKISALLLATCLISAVSHAEVKQHHMAVVFIQNAKSSELSLDAKHAGDYTLTLHHPEAYVSYFSDRPDRVTGMVATTKFLKLWKSSNSSNFKNNPPNAALETKDSNLIGTLTDPHYNKKTDDVTYHFSPLNKVPSSITPGKNLGYTVLFVDDISWDPGGFGNVG